MKRFTLLLAGLFAFGITWAQHTVTGTVTEAGSDDPIPGVNILHQASGTGTITQFDGTYTIELPSDKGNLHFSFMGYESQIIAIEGRSEVNVSLVLATQEMDEVVVTAFGIKREKKALGYSVTDVKTEELSKVRDVNVINSVAGKVAGVQISQTAGGPGSSSRIVIRGNSSIEGNNQPLIVVDGVPIDNTNYEQPTWLGGIDYGSGISDINPDDIASMSILKGPNAAALYGSRAANGVVVIETKKGSQRKGLGITFTSNNQLNIPYLLGQYQNEYAMGANGVIPRIELTPEQQDRYGTDSLPYTHHYGSWGPKISDYEDEVLHWYGEVGPLEAHPNNVRDYFPTGYTSTNTLSIEGGDEKATFRMSYSNLRNKGIKPNSRYNRNNILFRGTLNLTERLNIDTKVNYIREDAFNRVGMGDSRTGMRNFIWMPRNIDVAKLKEHMEDENGYEQNWYTDDPWHQNPYWVSFKNTNNDNKDRIIANTSLNYQLTDWLGLTLRASTDFYKSRRYRRVASYSLQEPTGRHSESWIAVREMNYDFLLSGQYALSEDFALSYTAGGSSYDSHVDINRTTIIGFAVPNFFSLNNVKDPLNRSQGTTVRRKRINSLYGSGQLAFRNYLFLDVTGRNDWSSTLPLNNNSYFYPSVSLSFALTEALGISSDFLTFGKLRASWARVGNDADPYMLQPSYVAGNFGSYPTNFLESSLPINNLKPETTESIEFGADFRFFQNRLGIDASLYQQRSYNQILSAEVSKASGFDNAVINAGEIENKGIELLLSLTPIRSQNIRWDASFNFAKNLSEVVSLADGISTYTITEESQVLIEARPGDPYGNIRGTTVKKVNGEYLVNNEGLYEVGEREIIGNITPDWTGGFNTSFSYKQLSLGLNIAISMGGDLFSKTNKYGNDNGQFEITLDGRESWYNATEEEKLAGDAGYVADGVLEDGTPNTRGINPQVYWHQYKWGGIAELSIYDASYVKLKQAYITYTLPKKWLADAPVQSASISLTGNNLWLIYSGVPNIDPEASAFSSGNNGLGQEYAPMPSTRDIGFDLKIRF